MTALPIFNHLPPDQLCTLAAQLVQRIESLDQTVETMGKQVHHYKIVEECRQPGISVSSVAWRHGINANVVRRWIPAYRHVASQNLPAFIPLACSTI